MVNIKRYPPGTPVDEIMNDLKSMSTEELEEQLIARLDSILEAFSSISPYAEYSNQVFKYLKELGYLDMVSMFDPEQVAGSVAGSIQIMWRARISPRMAALSIYGVTYENQIIPHAQRLAAKHGVN